MHARETEGEDAALQVAKEFGFDKARKALRYCRGAEYVASFGLAGMLHDTDFAAWPEEHPRRIVAWLVEQKEREVAHAASAHHTKWGVPHESTLGKTLLAYDELIGFIGACCHVREGRLMTLEPKSVVKKLKDKGLAAKVERGEVSAGVELLGVDLSARTAFVIESLRPHTDELGLPGRANFAT